MNRTGRKGFQRKDTKPKPIKYKGFLITFSVLSEANKGNKHFYSIREYKSQSLTDVKKQIDKSTW